MTELASKTLLKLQINQKFKRKLKFSHKADNKESEGKGLRFERQRTSSHRENHQSTPKIGEMTGIPKIQD